MGYLKLSAIKYAGLLVLGILLLSGCLKEGVRGDYSTSFRLVVVPSAQQIEVGENLHFDILLAGEIVNADLYINGQKIQGNEYQFKEEGIYSVFAKKEGARNSDTLEIRIGEPAGTQLLLNTSKTEISEGETVTFIAQYEILGDIATADDAEFYIDGVKIAGDSYQFNAAGTFNVIAKNETFKDSDPVTITVTVKSEFTVFIAGYLKSTTSGKRFAHCWRHHASGISSLTLDIGLSSNACVANGITIAANGDIYLPGAVDDYSRNAFSAIYWKRNSTTGITRVTLKEGDAETTSVAIDNGDVYMAGRIEGHPVYWKNKTLVDLAEAGSNYSFTASDIATYNGDVYVAGGTMVDEAPSDAQAFYWKNNAAGKVALLADGAGTVALGIAIHNGSIYVSGGVMNSYFPDAAYWKDGDIHALSTTESLGSVGNDIAVKDNNVYIAGDYINRFERKNAVVWINNKMTILNDSNEFGGANAIVAASDGTIFVAGWIAATSYGDKTPVYWQIDASGNVLETVRLTGPGEATGIALEK